MGTARTTTMARARILDPETCLALRKSEGSWQGAARSLEAKGLISPSTGRPFSRTAVEAAAKKSPRYASWRASCLEKEARAIRRARSSAKK
jgi:hypothetical protein